MREKEENKKDQYAEKKNLNWDPCTEDAQTKPLQLKSSHWDTKEIWDDQIQLIWERAALTNKAQTSDIGIAENGGGGGYVCQEERLVKIDLPNH